MSDEFDNIPDPFADVNVDWDKLLGTQPAQTTTSDDDFSDDEPLDPAFLRELDLLDGTAPPPGSIPTEPPSSYEPQTMHKFDKRPRTESSPEHSTSAGESQTKKKRKMARILDGFEDELTCAICCDLLAAAHLLNPCGHSFCGECVWQWNRVKMKSNCPVCRTALKTSPMAPNIALDKLVDVHIQMLALGGQEGGEKLADITARRKKWKDGVAEREKQRVWLVEDSDSEEDEDDSEYDEDEEDIVFVDPPLPHLVPVERL
ncbi:hypothetical protein C8F01DRAFT_1110870 [Mycena amicta]|nr:hypothetical protein C8F01DRAFT_1110870 [Mycena amicta]